MTKNQLPRSIRKGDMRVFRLFHLEKELFLATELKFGYADVVKVIDLDVPLGGLEFSATLRPLAGFKT